MTHGPTRSGDGSSRRDDRAVSDVVGYVLVFSLVVATIGTVFAVGIAGLDDRRNAERVENVERAFDVLDDNLRDVQRHEDPSRATEIRLGGGTLSLPESTTVTVEGVDTDGNSVGNNTTRTIHAISYRSGDTEIVHEMGAWFRSDGGVAHMRSSPRFVAEDGRTALPLVRVRPAADGATATEGDGTVQVTASSGGSPQYTYPEGNTTPHEIRIRIESPRSDAWERYFDETDEFDVDEDATTDDEVVAVMEHDEAVYVRVIAIDVAFRR